MSESKRYTLADEADPESVHHTPVPPRETEAERDERFGRLAYEAFYAHEDAKRKVVGLGCWGHTAWGRLGSNEASAWTAAAKAVRVEATTINKGPR